MVGWTFGESWDFMAKKKQTHIDNKDMERMGEYLESCSPPPDILAIWTQIQMINLYLQVALAASTRLRQLFLKAIRVVPSSEKLRTRSKRKSDDSANSADSTVKKLEKQARKLESDARGRKGIAKSLRAIADYFRNKAKPNQALVPVPPPGPLVPKTPDKPYNPGPGTPNSASQNQGEPSVENQKPTATQKWLKALVPMVAEDEERDDTGVMTDIANTSGEDFPTLEQEAEAIGLTNPAAGSSLSAVRARITQPQPHDDPLLLQPSPPQILYGHHSGTTPVEDLPLIRCETAPEGISYRRSIEESTRLDCSLVVRKVRVSREILYDPISETRYVAPQTMGPKGFSITWNTLNTITRMSVEMHMPLHRISRLVSTADHTVSRGQLGEVLAFVAEALHEPFLANAKTLAQHAWHLYGDDTVTRTRGMKPSPSAGDETPPPLNSETKSGDGDEGKSRDDGANDGEAGDGDCSDEKEDGRRFSTAVMEAIHTLLPRDWIGRDGEPKTRLNTTVVASQIDFQDPTSWIVLYHTHFGSCGDLIDGLLAYRHKQGIPPRNTGNREDDQNAGDLNVICDASSSNYPKDTHGYHVNFGFCAMHARRKFDALTEDTAENDVREILHLFSVIYTVEACITALGRTVDRTLRLRLRWSLAAWGQILARCEAIENHHRPDSPLGKAAHYVIKYFSELTRYLGNPFMMPDSGLVERYIRPLRVEENGNHGLETERGRMVRDVIRSLLATCRAIEVDFYAYLQWACEQWQLPPEQRLSAEERTPQSYAKRRAASDHVPGGKSGGCDGPLPSGPPSKGPPRFGDQPRG